MLHLYRWRRSKGFQIYRTWTTTRFACCSTDCNMQIVQNCNVTVLRQVKTIKVICDENDSGANVWQCDPDFSQQPQPSPEFNRRGDRSGWNDGWGPFGEERCRQWGDSVLCVGWSKSMNQSVMMNSNSFWFHDKHSLSSNETSFAQLTCANSAAAR